MNVFLNFEKKPHSLKTTEDATVSEVISQVKSFFNISNSGDQFEVYTKEGGDVLHPFDFIPKTGRNEPLSVKLSTGMLRLNTNRLTVVASTRACSHCFTFLFAHCVWFCIALFLRFPS